MKSFVIVCLAVCLVAGAFAADETSAKTTKAEDRLKAAADVLNEIQSAPDQGIPEEVLGSAIELSRQSQRLRDEVDRFLAHIRAA